jgi:hypothetical protein
MMAYLDFGAGAVDLGAYQTTARSTPAQRPVSDRLGGAERAAVMLARKDDVSSLKAAGRVSRILQFAFGVKSPNKLADIRLETLRRFAVAVAHERTRLIEWERNELRLLRFTEAQIDEAVEVALRFRREHLQGGWIYALFGLLLAASFLAARNAVGDTSLALFLVGLPALAIWAIIAPRHRSPSRRA